MDVCKRSPHPRDASTETTSQVHHGPRIQRTATVSFLLFLHVQRALGYELLRASQLHTDTCTGEWRRDGCACNMLYMLYNMYMYCTVLLCWYGSQSSTYQMPWCLDPWYCYWDLGIIVFVTLWCQVDSSAVCRLLKRLSITSVNKYLANRYCTAVHS